MGEVFAAENVRTGRHVAVKLLRADSKAKTSAVERFRREARAAGSINSDHVTQVLDVEEDPEHGIVLVFELLEGESLIDRLKRTGPIPFEELHGIIEQVWMGLADAHRVGIIHRDLKPSNVFLERRPDGQMRVKILDFGISKLPKEMGGETLTEMGQSLGTFSFMPPEQIGKAKTVDHRADIYACATLIYQALSGQLPYSARNILVMVELKSKTDPRSLSEAMDRPVDPRLEAFLRRGLAREPGDRFQSAVEALSAWREMRPQSSVLPTASVPPPTPPAMPTTPSSMSPRSAPVSHGPQQGSGSSRLSATPASTSRPQPSSGHVPHGGAPNAGDMAQGPRPRGGTLAMETTFESTAPTKPMQAVQSVPSVPSVPQSASAQLRPVSPSVMPGQPTREPPRSMGPGQDPRSAATPLPYQDPRSAQGQYGSGVFPPSSSHAQGPYNAQAYAQQPPQQPQPPQQQQPQQQQPQQQQPQQQPQNIYDENSKNGPASQAQTRVYNPSQNPGYNPNAIANAVTNAGSGGNMSASSSGNMAPLSPLTSATPVPASSGGSLRVVLWFIAFAVVGFGIVATLHYLEVF
jgi:serine/threonine protein kinase